MENKLYIAYGSNLNLKQMSERCPTSKVLCKSRINGYRLSFRGMKGGAVASIEPAKGKFVPVLVWSITPLDESALDRYEGWPILYRKELMKVKVDGKQEQAMVYIMNEGRPFGVPGCYYYSILFDGYKDAGFNLEILKEAVEFSEKGEDI